MWIERPQMRAAELDQAINTTTLAMDGSRHGARIVLVSKQASRGGK
jgi:hypothetical protein